jgi:hypothetical protein
MIGQLFDANAALTGVVMMAVFFAFLCKKGDSITESTLNALVTNTKVFYYHAQLPTLELQIVFLCKLLKKEIAVVVLFEYPVFARFSFVLATHKPIWQ